MTSVDPPDSKSRVAVWRDSFAPYSETFIWNEVRHHIRYRATVFAHTRLNKDRFPWDDVITLDSPPILGPMERCLYRLTALSPRFGYRLARGGFRLVHAHFGTAAICAMPYALSCGLPLIASFHGSDLSRLFGPLSRHPANWPYRLLAPQLLRRARLILTASGELCRQLLDAGCSAHKLRIFRLGIDLSLFRRERRPDKHLHILMVGRLVAKKGFDDALRAIGRQKPERISLRVSIVGDGPLRASLERLALELGLATQTTFTGALPQPEVAALLADADLLMAPSFVTREGDRDSGIIAVKEAAASGLPCLGTRHGGLPEIVDDSITGFLVPERNVDALGKRLETLLLDADLRRRMGHAARLKMEREYDISRRTIELEEIYDNITPVSG